MFRHRIALGLIVFLAQLACVAEPAFTQRGYYMTFMRMPAFGLAQWKQIVNCIQEDGGNTLLLWTAGGFRSKQFPETWAYNADHKNVQSDFARELIEYAHTKNIKVLLCFTPFAYDGVNQYSIKRPELRAIGKDGKETQFWGMHSWGYNLCPSKPESQRFMLGYIREMFFDFYTNADGLMIESSDYAICYCANCREKFFEREFQFVRRISDEVWKANPNATIAVYPHYFSGSKVPGFDVKAATEKFDSRWTLFFTPHSAHIDSVIISKAKTSIYSTEGLTLGSPAKIRDAARLARKHGLTGFVPSLEPFTCPAGPPDNPGPRLKPFHFGWLSEGEMPLNELPMRVNRIAYAEYSRNPDLSEQEFRRIVGRKLFDQEDPPALEDAFFVRDCCFQEAEWFKAPPLLAGSKNRRLPEERLAQLKVRVERLGVISTRYRTSTNSSEHQLHKIASWIVQQWQ